MDQKKVSEGLKKHHNTVSAKNNVMTSILTLKDINVNEINIDYDLIDLLNDLQFVVDYLKKGTL